MFHKSISSAAGMVLLLSCFVLGREESVAMSHLFHNRPSLVMLRARKVGNSHDIRVGGCVVPVAQSKLL